MWGDIPPLLVAEDVMERAEADSWRMLEEEEEEEEEEEDCVVAGA